MSTPLILAVCPGTSPQEVGSSDCGGGTAAGGGAPRAPSPGARCPDATESDSTSTIASNTTRFTMAMSPYGLATCQRKGGSAPSPLVPEDDQVFGVLVRPRVDLREVVPQRRPGALGLGHFPQH